MGSHLARKRGEIYQILAGIVFTVAMQKINLLIIFDLLLS